MAKKRKTRAPNNTDTLNRMIVVEGLMVRCVPQKEIIAQLCESWGVSQTTIYRYIKKVRDLWRSEAEEKTREAMRDEHRALLHNIANLALTKKTRKQVREPVLDKNENPTGEIMTVTRSFPDPDLGNALAATRQLASLDNLDDHVEKHEHKTDLSTAMGELVATYHGHTNPGAAQRALDDYNDKKAKKKAAAKAKRDAERDAKAKQNAQ